MTEEAEVAYVVEEYGVQRTLVQWNGGEPFMEWGASRGPTHNYEYTAESVFGLADGNPVFKRTRIVYKDKVSEPVQVSRKDVTT